MAIRKAALPDPILELEELRARTRLQEARVAMLLNEVHTSQELVHKQEKEIEELKSDACEGRIQHMQSFDIATPAENRTQMEVMAGDLTRDVIGSSVVRRSEELIRETDTLRQKMASEAMYVSGSLMPVLLGPRMT